MYGKDKIGLILMRIGIIGFLAGGSGLDGPSWELCGVLTSISFAVAAAGYKYYGICQKRGEKHKTAEKTIARSKEATFQAWLTCGKLDEKI